MMLSLTTNTQSSMSAQNTLLLLTNSYDVHTCERVAECTPPGMKVIIVHVDCLDDRTHLDVVDGRWVLTVDGRTLDEATVGAVWFRKPYHWWFQLTDEYHKLPQQTKDLIDYKRKQVSAAISLYVAHLRTQGVPIVPDPSAVHELTYSKAHQLHVAHQCGLRTPKTLQTSSKEAIRAFVNAHPQAIIKNLHSTGFLRGELFRDVGATTRVNVTNLDDYLSAKATPFPMIVQEEVQNKIDIRVTCVDDTVFAVSMRSKRTSTPLDVRLLEHGDVQYESLSLPSTVIQQLLAINKTLGLRYAAVDLAYVPDTDTHYFLEVNPYGQYMFVEDATGLPITKTIVQMFERIIGKGR